MITTPIIPSGSFCVLTIYTAHVVSTAFCILHLTRLIFDIWTSQPVTLTFCSPAASFSLSSAPSKMSIVTLTSRPALHHALTSPAASPDKTQTKMPNFELPEPPTPISPILAQDSDQLSDAGPSQISHASPRPPPPPPSYPRRHRSGVLMSRVRAKSSATSFKTGMIMTPSKSWGDLGGRGVNEEQESNLQADEDEPAGDTLIRRDGWKRVVSAGHRRAGEEVDDSLWDNR